MQPSHQRQPPSPRPPLPTPSHTPDQNYTPPPFTGLSELRAPRTLSRSHEEPTPSRIDQGGLKNSLLLEGSIALLNAKISLGYSAALSTLGTLAYASGAAILHNVSGLFISAATFIISGATCLRGLALASRRNQLNSNYHKHLTRAGYPSDHPSTRRVQAIVSSLCNRHNIPEPPIVVMHDSTPNAGYVDRVRGRNLLITTSGLVSLLDNRELEGVIAHELSHQNRWFNWAERITCSITKHIAPLVWCGGSVASYSALCSEMGSILATSTAVIAGFGVIRLAAMPLRWCQGMISRHNEIKTDLHACTLTGDPEALISALTKIHREVPEAECSSHSHPTLQDRTTNIRKAFGLLPRT
jgi:Zn-dependent protease with chaperone function